MDNRCVTDLVKEESDLTVVILYQNDMQRASIMSSLQQKLGGTIQDRSSLWTIILRNRSCIRLVHIGWSQMELKGVSISLLLFPNSVEYNVRQKITRELYPQLIRNDGENLGSIGSIQA